MLGQVARAHVRRRFAFFFLVEFSLVQGLSDFFSVSRRELAKVPNLDLALAIKSQHIYSLL
jgi:hypothetical protein